MTHHRIPLERRAAASLMAAGLAFLPVVSSAQSALNPPLKEDTQRLAQQAAAERRERAEAVDPQLTIQRTSCQNTKVMVEDRTGRTVRSADESLETTAVWTVRGKKYSLVYYYHPASSVPVPAMAQLVSRESARDAGKWSETESKVLMVETNGRVKDFGFRQENYQEIGADGIARMYRWTDGAKGEPVTEATQEKQQDGSVRVLSRSVSREVRGGWRDGGSEYNCVIRSLSRPTWLALANDPKLANEVSDLDTLSFRVNEAERAYAACTQETCPTLYEALAKEEQAFLAQWNAVYATRKEDLRKKFAAIQYRRQRQRRPRRPRGHYLSSGEQAALDAVNAALEQSHRNAVERELREIREQLERRRRHR